MSDSAVGDYFPNKKLKQEKNQCVNAKTTHSNVPSCASCHSSIDDKYLCNLMNMYWHEECLLCSQCGCALNQTCFFKNGQLYCKDDYLK